MDRVFNIIHSCAAAREGTRVDVSKLLPKICFVELSSSGSVLSASLLLMRWSVWVLAVGFAIVGGVGCLVAAVVAIVLLIDYSGDRGPGGKAVMQGAVR